MTPEFLERVDSARDTRAQFREELGFDGRFVVGYAGVHGFSQGLDTILRSAELLKDYEDISFVFFGDGPEKPALQAMAVAKQLTNIRFFAPEAPERMAAIWTAIDASIVPLKRTDLFKGALPSKLFEAIGAGVPVIAAVEGEAKKLVELSEGGLVVEPENCEELASAVLRLYQDPGLRQRLGAQGRHYIAANYNRRTIADRFESLLVAITSSDSAPGRGMASPGPDECRTEGLELISRESPKVGN